MTKIAITPNASGSGVFTIAAPNSNDDRTFTLPDATGEVLTDAENNPAKLFRRDNILGTVSQSGGVPTGAIIERGSNANGEFVKYADGTMICITALSPMLRTGDGGPVDGFARSDTVSFTYAASFSSVDYVAGFKVETGSTGGTDFVSFASSNTNYLANVNGISAVLITAPVAGRFARIKILAIGRWF